jgi:hypothetical protein
MAFIHSRYTGKQKYTGMSRTRHLLASLPRRFFTTVYICLRFRLTKPFQSARQSIKNLKEHITIFGRTIFFCFITGSWSVDVHKHRSVDVHTVGNTDLFEDLPLYFR